MLRLWRGAGLSGWDPAAFGIATPAIVVGSQALHATGYALGITLDGADSAALAYFGDGATQRGRRRRGPRLRRQLHGARGLLLPEQPVGHLGAGAPAVARRPSRSGARATASPGSRWTATTCWPSSPPPGWRSPGPTPDGGPTLIEAVTYRMGPHTTSDDPTRYRTRVPRRRSGAPRTPWPGCGALLHTEGWPTSGSRRSVERGGEGGRRGVASRLPGHGGSRAGDAVRRTSTPNRIRCSRRSGPPTRRTWTASTRSS